MEKEKQELTDKLLKMTIKEREEYFNNNMKEIQQIYSYKNREKDYKQYIGQAQREIQKDMKNGIKPSMTIKQKAIQIELNNGKRNNRNTESNKKNEHKNNETRRNKKTD